MKIKPIIHHPKKGKKIINFLTLKKIDSDNQEVNVTYEELVKFLKINDSDEKINDKKVLVKLNPKYKYEKIGMKMIKSLTCNPISDNNQISNNQINISFQNFNDNDYQLELFNDNDIAQNEHQKDLNFLINTLENKIKDDQKFINNFKEKINKSNKLEEQNYKKIKNDLKSQKTNISNILDWSANLSTFGAGITSLIPTIGTISSASCTMLSAGFSITNSIIKNRNNNSEIENLEMENTNNFISIQIEDEINSMDLTNEPSTSNYKPLI